MARKFGHICFVLLMLTLLVVLPIRAHFDLLAATETDADTGASMQLPDEPSGDFVILLNESLHEGSVEQWERFFTGDEVDVIFDDLSCLVAPYDASARQLAERYQATLPENQMALRTEDASMMVSKAETGHIDMVILSKELADSLELADESEMQGIRLIRVTGSSDAA